MLKWGWDTKMAELVNLTRFGCKACVYNIIKHIYEYIIDKKNHDFERLALYSSSNSAELFNMKLDKAENTRMIEQENS